MREAAKKVFSLTIFSALNTSHIIKTHERSLSYLQIENWFCAIKVATLALLIKKRLQMNPDLVSVKWRIDSIPDKCQRGRKHIQRGSGAKKMPEGDDNHLL